MIEFEHVDFAYGKLPFIEALDLKVKEGTVSTIIGPNGSGKSTVLGLMAGLLRPKAGTIRIAGADINGWKGREQARRISFVPQTQVRADMEVERLVMAGRFPHQGAFSKPKEEDRCAVEQALRLTGCGHIRKKNLKQLSGGEVQRAYLAMAMAQDTEVILLDEPTAHLDLKVSHEMMELAVRLKEEWGKTVVMVLHELNLALDYSKQLTVMDHGRVIASGSSDQILRSGAIQQAFSMEPHRFAADGKVYWGFDAVGQKKHACPLERLG